MTNRAGKTCIFAFANSVLDGTAISIENFADKTEYNDTDAPTWKTMEEAGAVCLPAAGYRYESTVCGVGVSVLIIGK